MLSVLKRLFPTLADWPVEKWMGLPLGLFFLLGIVGGIMELWFRP
jgi:hypothetical protein